MGRGGVLEARSRLRRVGSPRTWSGPSGTTGSRPLITSVSTAKASHGTGPRTGTGCRPKPSGSTPAGPARVGRGTGRLARSPGTGVTRGSASMPWAENSPTRGAFTTCSAMSGTGAGTSTTPRSTARTGYSAAVAGSTSTGAAELPRASARLRAAPQPPDLPSRRRGVPRRALPRVTPARVEGKAPPACWRFRGARRPGPRGQVPARPGPAHGAPSLLPRLRPAAAPGGWEVGRAVSPDCRTSAVPAGTSRSPGHSLPNLSHLPLGRV